MDAVKAKSENLTKILQDVGTAVYQQAAAEQAKKSAEEQGPQGGPDGKKVVDSEDYKVNGTKNE